MNNPIKGYWFLDGVAGWREARRDSLSLTAPDRFIVLDPLPGTASLPLDAATQTAHFECPAAVAVTGCGDDLALVDAATSVVTLVNLAIKSVAVIPSFGRDGTQPRRLHKPRGVCVLASGSIVVADTGNHRVQIFAPDTHALLQVWGAAGPLGSPIPGDGPAEFRWPWAVAVDQASVIHVVDRGNHRVQKISYDGTWLGEFGADELQDPTRLALASNGDVAVVDQQRNAVVVFKSEGSSGRKLQFKVDDDPLKPHWPKQPRSVAFDDQGNIYVGDATGLVYVGQRDSLSEDGFRVIGSGMSGLSGTIVDLAWSPTQGLIAIILENYNGQRQRLWQIDPRGGCVLTGTFITTALDSGIEGCQWHRVLLDATVPLGTTLEIDSYASDVRTPDAQVTGEQFGGWTRCVIASSSSAGPSAATVTEAAPQSTPDRPNDSPDCLVQGAPGQYLWLRLIFKSSVRVSPEMRWLKAFFPRKSYLQYLPAVYQEDDESRLFLDRFLSVFQTDIDNFGNRLGTLWQLFDPASADADKLAWLAGWIGLYVSPDWKPGKLRQMIKDAPGSYRERGTVAGLEQLIADYSGVPAKILEHFRLRQWPVLGGDGAALDRGVRLWSRDFYHQLQVSTYSQVGAFQLRSRPAPALEPFDWGANKFTVFFAADPYNVDASRNQVAQVVEREKPAHTEATLCPVFPRFRVGVQATIGVDSQVGGITNLVLNNLATLNYDSILACSKTEQSIRKAGSAPRPETGVTTKLL